MIASPMMSVWGGKNIHGLVKPLHLDLSIQLHFGNP